MPSSLPLELIAAWVLFFGSVSTHQRHASNFRGASQGFATALRASALIGTLVGLALLVYYFFQVNWYWPIVLFAVGSILGGIVFGLLDAKIAQPAMSLLAFLCWPAGALWALLIIRAIAA